MRTLTRSAIAASALVLITGASALAAETPLPTAPDGPVTSAPESRITATSIPITVESMSMDGAATDIGVDNRSFRLSSDVLFDFDQATLKPRAKQEITRIAGLLKPQAGQVRTVEVSGHTSSEGTDQYNQKLSEQRAEAVRSALQPLLGSGLTVVAKGYGETKPIADNSTEAGAKKNRRVEIVAR
jgi:outer membrane protein OmpA-like peptidoglycan-associated protein